RLRKELAPLEEQLLRARLETFRVLGGHLREGRLRKRSASLLKEALRGLADELEFDFGLDLREDRRIYLGEHSEDIEDATVQAGRPGTGAHKRADGDLRDEDDDPMAWDEDGGPRPMGDGDGKAGGNKGKYGPSEEGRSRRKRPDSKAAKMRAEKEQALAGDIRALYLLLARALHPDKESNPALREAKTTWMQKVTTAYANKDLAILLDILVCNPLEAVGPYLSQAPLKTVQGFAKRLRRDLAALRRQAERAEEWIHPFFARFVRQDGAVDEAAVARHLGGLRREVKLAKKRLTLYRTLEGAEDLAAGLRIYDWRELI
ncbi:MAG TPA: hypothetical protein VK465_13135, partial [Fibrobacteria bacterium]|nr:hypothetical protein [Fibrobacteria bacterium]